MCKVLGNICAAVLGVCGSIELISGEYQDGMLAIILSTQLFMWVKP